MKLSFPSKVKKVLHRSTVETLFLLIAVLVVMRAITLRLFVGLQLDSCTLILTLRLGFLSMSLKELCLSAQVSFPPYCHCCFFPKCMGKKDIFHYELRQHNEQRTIWLLL